MYPRVKVREDTRDDHEKGQITRKSPRNPLVGLKALEFLSIHDYHSPEAKSYGRAEEQPRVVFAECTVRIPDGNVSNGTTRANTVDKGKDTNSDEDNKAHIRASSVPRPRAVLSSPDNDAMIGKKNRKATVQSSALRNHNRLQTKDAHLQLMAPTENVGINAQLKRISGRGNMRKPKAPSDTNAKRAMPKSQEDAQSNKVASRQTFLRAGKPNAARF